MTALLTADWYPCGDDGYFRKIDAYEMGWSQEIEMDNAIVIPAPFGGPIAVIRDRVRSIAISLKGIGKPMISIYSSSGGYITSVVWNSGHLVQLGWSLKEELLCVQEDGFLIISTIYGKYKHAISLGAEAEQASILAALIYPTANGDTGICILTGLRNIFITESIENAKMKKLAKLPGAQQTPNAWAAVFNNGKTSVLLSSETELYQISDNQVIQKNIVMSGEERKSIITDMSVSWNYQSVALYNSQRQLWIGTSDLRRNYRCFTISFTGRPKQIVWCGCEAVATYWDDTLMIVGVGSDSLSYVYDGSVTLLSEMDCIRVIGVTNTDIIQPVPKVLLDMYRINSSSPASYLLEASKQFEKKHYRAHEYIELVLPEMLTAVDECIRGAALELNPANQKILLKAVQFGKLFLRRYNSDSYVRMVRTLRVLNAARHHDVGITLTYPQYEYLSLQNLLDRLILRKQFYLAIQSANYMRLTNEEGSARILQHWAFYKVSQLNVDNEQVAQAIANKLGSNSGVSFIDIAEKAVKCGKDNLAVKLLDYEPKSALQVSTLLKLERYDKRYEDALTKAVYSGNTDLINYVMLVMKRKSPHNFLMEVRKDPLVFSLYKKYCRIYQRESLLTLYRQEDDYSELAACYVIDSCTLIKESGERKSVHERCTLLELAKENYKKCKNETDYALCDEQKKLLLKQKELQEKLRDNFINLPLRDTIYKLMLRGEHKIVDEMRNMFKVTDKRYFWLKIQSLAEQSKWSELEKFSKTTKAPPIGFEAFADICLKYDQKDEARKYIPGIKLDNRVIYLFKIGNYSEAVKIAESQQNVNALQYILANGDVATCEEATISLRKVLKAIERF